MGVPELNKRQFQITYSLASDRASNPYRRGIVLLGARRVDNVFAVGATGFGVLEYERRCVTRAYTLLPIAGAASRNERQSNRDPKRSPNRTDRYLTHGAFCTLVSGSAKTQPRTTDVSLVLSG